MVDSEPFSTTSRPAARDSAPTSLRSQQLLVVAGTQSIDGLYRPVVVAGFLRFLELLVMGVAPWTWEPSLTLCSDTFCHTILAGFQDHSMDRRKPLRHSAPEGLPDHLLVRLDPGVQVLASLQGFTPRVGVVLVVLGKCQDTRRIVSELPLEVRPVQQLTGNIGNRR